jgi:hypothetical protein
VEADPLRWQPAVVNNTGLSGEYGFHILIDTIIEKQTTTVLSLQRIAANNSILESNFLVLKIFGSLDIRIRSILHSFWGFFPYYYELR